MRDPTNPFQDRNEVMGRSALSADSCGNCRFFRRGYRLQGLKVPPWCDRHFHAQSADDPACQQHERIDVASIPHPPYDHPGDFA